VQLCEVDEQGRENWKFSLPRDALEINHIPLSAWCWRNLQGTDWSQRRDGTNTVFTFYKREHYMMFVMVWG
jgi:hypothetical protein